MELVRRKCPACHSADMQYHSPSPTKHHGGRVMYTCAPCPASCSETKKTLLEGLKTPVSVLGHVSKARTEGLGLHAAPRTFDHATNTLRAWERTCVALPRVLLLSTLVHACFAIVREGDEA